ncbi:MAG: T9SS type A sorting domain-containing protein [Kaistella sp.]
MNKLYLNFRRQLVFIVLLLPFLGLGQALSGPYTINSANTDINFKSLSSAVAKLNSVGISGPVTFLLDQDQIITSQIEIKKITGSSLANTLTIRPNVGKNITISGNIHNGAVLAFNNADNILIDGNNRLTIYNTNNFGYGQRAGVWFYNGSDGNKIQNLKIKLEIGGIETGILSVGFFAGGNSLGSSGNNPNNTLQNITFTNVKQAIMISGQNQNSTDWRILNNTIESTDNNTKPFLGIYILNAANYTVSGNKVNGIRLPSNFSGSTNHSGIYLENANNGIIEKNIVSNIESNIGNGIGYGIYVKGNNNQLNNNSIKKLNSTSTTEGSYGIRSEGNNTTIYKNDIADIFSSQGKNTNGIYISGNNQLVYNNLINDVKSAGGGGINSQNGFGIYINSGRGVKLYYNTVVLKTNQNSGVSAALFINGGTQLDIRNNIFQNRQSSLNVSRFAIYSSAASFSTDDNLNYNDYNSQQHIGSLGNFNDSNNIKTTLDAWKTATGKDKNSINFSPIFVSPSDLHLKVDKRNIDALRAGTSITGILTDIDGEIRNATKPYMGADELLCLLATPVAQITQPTCDLPTGSIALSQLPPGKWTIIYELGIISGTGTTTVLSNLPSRIYNIKVSTEEGCTSELLTVELDPVTNTWDGNWSAKKPPTINQHIVFKDDFVSKTDIEGCSCTVERGDVVFKSLGDQRGFNLTVAKEVKVMTGGSLTFESNTNLLQLDKNAVNSGKITVEREIKDMDNVLTGPGAQMDYVYWSSPVAGQKTKGLDGFSPGTPSNRFYSYRESNDYFYETTDLTFVAGRGYAVRAEVSPTIPANPKGYDKIYKFYGTPHNGEYAVVVKRSPNTGAGGGVIHGYNLIGNPYPSNIDFKKLYTQNLRVIYNTAWFWTNNSFEYSQQAQVYPQNNYAVYNGTGGAAASGPVGTSAGGTGNTAKPDGIISVGQGFIVQVREFDSVAGEQTLKFQHDNRGEKLRVSTPGAFFNRQSEQTNRFWLNLISPSLTVNNQLVGYIDGATDDFEQDYDAELLSFGSDVFYSVLGDRNLQIQGKAAFTQEDKVILGANFFSTGTYTIILEEAEGLFKSSQPIYLKDKETGKLTNLSQDSYTFDAVKGVSTGRFEIVYKPETVLGTGDESVQEIQVYRDAGNFVVRSRTKKITDIELYDTSGRLIYKDQPNAATTIINAEKLTAGMYILKIDQNGTITGKKILK